MSISRRDVLAGAAGLLSGVGQQAWAQAQIESLKIITGFTPGGTSDAICRRVAEKIAPSAYTKAAFVENKTGAGGQIAVQFVRNAPADGATVLQTPMSMLGIYPHIYKKLPYDPVGDLAPVSLGAVFDFGFAVGPMVPASVKIVPDFLAWCKANPVLANFGSPAAGSTPHFIGALLGHSANVDLKHVAFRGTQPAILDMIGGQIAAVSGPIGEFTQHVAAGKCRLLAASGAKRSQFAPNTPTLIEQGTDVSAPSWVGVLAPPKTPAAVVATLAQAMIETMSDPAIDKKLNEAGLAPLRGTTQEFATLIAKDYAFWGKAIRDAGIKVDQ